MHALHPQIESHDVFPERRKSLVEGIEQNGSCNKLKKRKGNLYEEPGNTLQDKEILCGQVTKLFVFLV